MTRRFLVAAVLAAAAAAAQDSPPEVPGSPRLLPVPTPALDLVEPAVRDQVGGERARLEAALAATAQEPRLLARLYGETGLLYLAYHFRDAALACFGNAEALAAGEFRWPYYAGVAHQESGDLAAAAEAYARALALDASYPAAWVRLGQVELGRHRLAEAEAAFGRALAREAAAAVARFGLGRIAAARGEPAAAVDHFRAALELQPQASAIHYPLALAYRALGQLEAAERHLKLRGEAEVSYPDPLVRRVEDARLGTMPHIEKASQAVREGRFSEAAEHFRGALAVHPGDSRALAGLAAALRASGDAEGAVTAYRELLAQEPGNASAQYDLGALLLERGGAEAARRHLTEAARLNPDLAQVHLRLGTALALAGRYAEAARSYERALALDPQDRETHRARAQAWLRAGDEAAAKAALEESIRRFADDGDLLHLLARLLAAASQDALRDGARALALARQVLAAQASPAHAETLAMALAEVGRFEEAASLQEAVVRSLEAETAPARAVERARRRLGLYRERKPCRSPWSE